MFSKHYSCIHRLFNSSWCSFSLTLSSTSRTVTVIIPSYLKASGGITRSFTYGTLTSTSVKKHLSIQEEFRFFDQKSFQTRGFRSSQLCRLPASYSNQTSSNCWKCGSKLAGEGHTKSTKEWHPSDIFFCASENCGALQPSYTNEGNYFKLFGFEEDYDVDTKLLSARFRKIQQRLHPDMAVNFDEVGTW